MVGVEVDVSVLKITLSPTAKLDTEDSPFLSMSLLDPTTYAFPSIVTELLPTAVTVPLLVRSPPRGSASGEEGVEVELELDPLLLDGCVVPVDALADIVAPRIAPPASPTATRPADNQSLGLVRSSSLNDMSVWVPFSRG
jgi:hypothetical protein